MNRCDECSFVYDDLAVSDAPSRLEALTGKIVEHLDRASDQAIRERPETSVWSALEYACHVRDVILIQRERMLLALVEDTPRFHPMYREERVKNAGYNQEQIGDLRQQIILAAGLLAGVVQGLTTEQQMRTCIYNYPAPTERDVAWLVRHTVHEAHHHEGDVRDVLARVSV